MTATFDQFVSEQDAKNTIQLNVTKWTLMLCDALEQDAPPRYKFVIESGRKYHKIVMFDSGNCRSVHAFVNMKTGEVYKAATWQAPAKHVRYDLRHIVDREFLFEKADWAGSYLYL
jgi:hypothetical protein